MLPSVRRVVSAAPSSPLVASLASLAPRAASATPISYGRTYKPIDNGHQRRYSSSKPSSADDGSRDFAARPAVPAAGESKTPGEKRKRKPKDVSAAPPLPSVPSTRHIKDEALAISTFFALHRPISVTQLLPKTVTEDSFAEIFTTRRGHRVQDVLSTLGQTVHDLEQPMAKLGLGDKQKAQPLDDDEGATRLSLKHADGTETSVQIQLNAMSGHFLPYTPPPPPKPLSEAQAAADEAAAAAAEQMAEQEPQTRTYQALVTIEESVDANGQYRVVAHTPQLVEENEPRSFLERLAQRQLRFEETRQLHGRTMHALSVVRIRKLKIKKKKYKKLMRKTRNIRRKMDRL
ncbi:hypothetical protein B0T18DRAFT_385799 [Schizothecium vesticola]|uniref:Small ribosomal subunit protein mS38 n=1 Tax=Schizothecium vesticola TaxID=314040 RepID=A0AA40F9Q5_9PEZI|nr:hypothetical protein B0T18DRAFT_385799 [Schizothecium vesticola]